MTKDLLLFLASPFVAGLILTGIHAYLGVHVVERGVIFVDLSLAQIAALGTTIAYLAGHELHSPISYFWSLGFTIIGAAVFALTRVHRETRIPQEAIIGIVYAVSAAAAILAMSKAPEGTEHLKDMLVGNILTVSWAVVIKTAVLYAIVGLFHFIFRKKFLAISLGNEIPNIKWWDFLFYTSFGFVVTSSVAIAGVLLVFSYLIVPSVAAMLFATTIGKRLAIGWTMGALVSGAGVMLSFFYDLPTGATIVCTFGIALALMAVVWRMTPAYRKSLGTT
ncbi:MAG TPA: metal ABC transporter permease [Thermoanaerobaculia bacterium]|nr:metal ABC transporter permease [Thermoanaerobaculia bacterium]